MNPFKVVKDFESALCEYTGAPYAVTTTSCTTALFLCLKWHLKDKSITIGLPKRTYIGVAMSVKNAGAKILFRDEQWEGEYQLYGSPIHDCARRFTSDMYREYEMQCVSFHWSKILSIGQGGAILHDNPEADEWLRRARFDGRTEGVSASEDIPLDLGYHAYMMPRDAAEGLSRLSVLPRYNKDLPNDDYPDLSRYELFA